MKYTREQRERAVDLYIKYECCAADVIRELGYPSRTALWMWHRDRLEEERAGVPSTRGERYKRYSEEQKRVAVDHYLEYGKRLSRTMRMLGYPKSRQLLMAWVDELAPGQRKLRHGPVPEELKREAVVAVASGRLKSHEAAARLGVQAAVVRNWKRQMLNHPKEEPVEKPAEKTMPADPVETSAVKNPLCRCRIVVPSRMPWPFWRRRSPNCRTVWTSWPASTRRWQADRPVSRNSTSSSRSGGARWN